MGGIRRFLRPVLALSLASFAVSFTCAAPLFAQNGSSEEVKQVVATLATGRVTAIAGHNGLVIAAVGTSSFEPGSLPPLIVPMENGDIAVVLGADDWVEPGPANRTLLRLDQQLPHLTNTAAAIRPSLNPGTNVPDIAQIGLAVLEPLRAAAENLHEQIHLPENLPLAELLLIRHNEQHPLAVWDVSYWIHQKFWQENFWSTEVDRPRYQQLYPTKQDKSNIVEVSYPPGETSSGLSAWLANPSGAFAQAIAANPKLADAQKQIARGKAGKVHMSELIPLVKTALETMPPSTAVKAMVAIGDKTGFSWIIQPAVSKRVIKRPAGAPTLGPQTNSP